MFLLGDKAPNAAQSRKYWESIRAEYYIGIIDNLLAVRKIPAVCNIDKMRAANA